MLVCSNSAVGKAPNRETESARHDELQNILYRLSSHNPVLIFLQIIRKGCAT